MLDGRRHCADAWSPDAMIYGSVHFAGAPKREIPGVEHAISWAAPLEAMVCVALTGGTARCSSAPLDVPVTQVRHEITAMPPIALP